ncbi:MAG: lactonase family protein [Acidobacteriaceae bacterium]|nr:lactonase family protein [Acidobacteriaceae bacterium]
MTTRREFLATAVALPSAAHALGHASQAESWVLLGTGDGKGIYRARWNASSGTLGTPELAVAAERPDYFALHPTLPVLYTVNELGDGQGRVSSYHLHRQKAQLKPLNSVLIQGSDPCYVSISHDGSALLTANYSSGSVTLCALEKNGRIGHIVSQMTGGNDPHGPVTERQEASHMHCATFSPDGNFVLACDLGDDLIRIFHFHEPAAMTPVAKLAAKPGAGPRHVAFHPNRRWMYCSNELDCTVVLYDWEGHVDGNSATAQLREREGSRISTLPPNVATKDITACEVLVSSDGRYLYVCNRGGLNDVVVYAIDAQQGSLQPLQRVSSGGQVPRIIAFDPSEHWLVACNQKAPGTVAVFSRDSTSGLLDEKPRIFSADTPMFIQWL